jgi:Mg/Co/Ni transporter MgtE
MAGVSGSSEFGERLADLMNAAGIGPRKLERMLAAEPVSVAKSTMYYWLDGSKLPQSVESLLAVVHACVAAAQKDVGPALRSDREWMAFLARVKQERDSRAGRSRQDRHEGQERRPGQPGPPPVWEALHPAEAADRLARLDKSDPDRAVAEMYAMERNVASDVLERMEHRRALSLLARVQPLWVAANAANDQWFCEQIHQMPSDRGGEVFRILSYSWPEAAARTLRAMQADQALRFLDVVEDKRLEDVLKCLSRDDIDQLLDGMTPACAATALAAHADWAAYMLMADMDRRRADAIVSRIGPERLAAVLGAAKNGYVARLIKKMDEGDAAAWLDRMKADHAAEVLDLIEPAHIAGLIRNLDRRRAAWWLVRMKEAHAGSVLDLIEPQDVAQLMAGLDQDDAPRYLGRMSPIRAARVLSALAETLGSALIAEILHQMPVVSVASTLAEMEADLYVPFMRRAEPSFVDLILQIQTRSVSSAKIVQIISAVWPTTGDIADLLVGSSGPVAARIAEALPAGEAADALSSLGVDRAHRILELVPREHHQAGRNSPFADRAIDRYAGKQIDILKAIELHDEPMAGQLAELLGLAPPKPDEESWYVTEEPDP